MVFVSTTGTWGLCATNNRVWNEGLYRELYISAKDRDYIVTRSKIVNLVGGILGYIPGVNFFSGLTRIGWGCYLIYRASDCVIDRHIGRPIYDDNKEFIGYEITDTRGLYNRGAFIGVCQIGRGTLEMLNMRVVNLVLGILLTIPNLCVGFLAIIDYNGSAPGCTRQTRPDHNFGLLNFIHAF
ncbi:hypothetical protein K0U07_04025 [bacterium]|nr:hypothetical protein [bacterium]